MEILNQYLTYLNERSLSDRINTPLSNKEFKRHLPGVGLSIAAGAFSQAGDVPLGVKFLGRLGVAMGLIALSVGVYRNYLYRQKNKCEDGNSRCKKMIKFKAYMSQISYLKSNIGKCSKEKNSDVCKKKVIEKIRNIEEKIKRIRGGN